jgi:hypothetical protein
MGEACSIHKDMGRTRRILIKNIYEKRAFGRDEKMVLN